MVLFLRVRIVWNGVNKTKGIEQSTVQRTLQRGRARKEEGGGCVGSLTLVESEA